MPLIDMFHYLVRYNSPDPRNLCTIGSKQNLPDLQGSHMPSTYSQDVFVTQHFSEKRIKAFVQLLMVATLCCITSWSCAQSALTLFLKKTLSFTPLDASLLSKSYTKGCSENHTLTTAQCTAQNTKIQLGRHRMAFHHVTAVLWT